MFFGAVLALFLCNAQDVYRSDGSRVVLMKNPTWKTEFIGLYETIRSEPFVVLLFPMFWCSNWFYTYQYNCINGAYFDTRTKSLNGLLYWMAQIFGALIFGYCLDIGRFSRSLRAKIVLCVLFVLTMVIWGGGYAFEKTYTRAEIGLSSYVAEDWTDPAYIGHMFLYMFYGFYDAAWQGSIYWYNSPLE